jgi:translocator protein
MLWSARAGWPGARSRVDNGGMTVTSPRSLLADQARATLVAVLAVVQVAVAALGGGGALGASIGQVAAAYRTPVLAAGWTFAIWGPIYLGFLAYAGYQAFPRQRHRMVHRRTGWWLAASAVFNTLWMVTWSGRLIPLAELLLIALMVCLAVVFGRLSREAADSGPERFAFRVPVALYTGWVSLAIVMGTAATGVWLGLPGTSAIATVASIIVLVAVAAVLMWVVFNGTAVVGYSAAVVWGLAGVAAMAPLSVSVTAVLVLLVVLGATVRRISAAANRTRAAFG